MDDVLRTTTYPPPSTPEAGAVQSIFIVLLLTLPVATGEVAASGAVASIALPAYTTKSSISKKGDCGLLVFIPAYVLVGVPEGVVSVPEKKYQVPGVVAALNEAVAAEPLELVPPVEPAIVAQALNTVVLVNAAGARYQNCTTYEVAGASGVVVHTGEKMYLLLELAWL